MKIGVVSDSHGNVDNTLRATQILSEHDIALVLHCGDIGSAAIIPLFAEWPTHFVFGNVDDDHAHLRQTIRQAGQTCHERFGELEVDNRRICFLHSDDSGAFFKAINSGDYELVCYGHTHKYEQHLQGETLVLNPGALHRANPHTLAIVDLDTMTADHFSLKQD